MNYWFRSVASLEIQLESVRLIYNSYNFLMDSQNLVILTNNNLEC